MVRFLCSVFVVSFGECLVSIVVDMMMMDDGPAIQILILIIAITSLIIIVIITNAFVYVRKPKPNIFIFRHWDIVQCRKINCSVFVFGICCLVW